MRPARIGLAALIGLIASFVIAGFAFAADQPAAAPPKPPEITKEAKQQGMKDAPALVQTAGLSCQVTDARFVGNTTDPKTKKAVKYYEVACANSMGFIVVDNGADAAPGWASCLDQARIRPDGKINAAACFLPENENENAQLAPFIAKTAVSCDPKDLRGIGHATDASYFEVACTNGRGYVLKTSAPPDPSKPVLLLPCLMFNNPQSPVSCKLTTPDSQLAMVDALAAQSGKNCQVKDKRYVLTTQDMNNFYEVVCADGKGYMLEEAPTGKLAQVIGCADADPIGGGCTLTNGHEAQTQQAGLYSRLAQAAGFNCVVSKYFPFPVNVTGRDVVELACSNRPDGAVGIFPGSSNEKAVIYNCGLSELVGYRCTFTKPDANYPQLTGDLRKLGKSSCAVSGDRVIGTTEDKATGYLEVACADGNPGYIISYTLRDMAPASATACPLAKDVAGGCQMPENNRHA
jgi:hypothetical protein